MYNGIGLETPRGSGTNGYVQRNLAHIVVNKDKQNYRSEDDIKRLAAQLNRPPNEELLAHDSKRRIEVRCTELADLMEDQGYDQTKIDEKVTEYRKLLLAKHEKGDFEDGGVDEQGRPVARETHARARLQLQKNESAKAAFGISDDYVEGSSMDRLNSKKTEPEKPAEAHENWQQRYEHETRGEPPQQMQIEQSSKRVKEEGESKRKSKSDKEKKSKRRRSASSSSSSSGSSSSSDSSDSDSSDSDDSSSGSSSDSSSSASESETKKRHGGGKSKSASGGGGDRKRSANREQSPSFKERRRITSDDKRRRHRSRSPVGRRSPPVSSTGRRHERGERDNDNRRDRDRDARKRSRSPRDRRDRRQRRDNLDDVD